MYVLPLQWLNIKWATKNLNPYFLATDYHTWLQDVSVGEADHLTKCQPDPRSHPWRYIWPHVNLTPHLIWPNVNLTWPIVSSLGVPSDQMFQPSTISHLTKCQPDLTQISSHRDSIWPNVNMTLSLIWGVGSSAMLCYFIHYLFQSFQGKKYVNKCQYYERYRLLNFQSCIEMTGKCKYQMALNFLKIDYFENNFEMIEN